MKSLIDYMKDNKRIGTFGNAYLDYKLKGINKGDLVLIGSRSGAGKSTIAELIATHNADRGVKVTLISLENFEGDNILNTAYYYYKELAKDYNLNLRDFVSGEFHKDLNCLEKAQELTEKRYKNINLINRNNERGFTLEDLKECLTDAKVNKGSELVIIDHLDYFDKLANESDNEHISNLMSEIREAQYALKIPIVAISHLRKNGDKECKVPSMDEFIGSSNKVKQSTIVVLFAPDDETNENRLITDKYLRSTWCCIRKLRNGGIDNTVGRLEFDTKLGKYSNFWCEYKINYYGTKMSEEPVITSKDIENGR